MTQTSLFEARALPSASADSRDLCFFQTPTWVCEELISSRYDWLGDDDLVLEPTCGEGRWLNALPEHIPAVGIELNDVRAHSARKNTGRRILGGDALSIELDFTPMAIIGNPPFQARFIDRLLDRAHAWLPSEGSCGLILPVFLMHEHERVNREARRWSIEMEALPRSIFPRLRLPVVFVRFEKRRHRTLVGFALFDEVGAFSLLPRHVKQILSHGRSPVWREVVFDAIRRNGGRAHLQAIYAAVEGRRPTPNPFWREKVRQTCQRYCTSIDRGVWALPEAAA